jgi:hypothetical protein
VQAVVADDEAGQVGRAAEPGEPGKAEQDDRDHGHEQAQGDQHRQVPALDLFEPTLHEQQQADVAAALELLAAPGNLTLDGRRPLSQRLEPSTDPGRLRSRSGAGLIRAVGVAVHPATPFHDHRVASGTGGVTVRTMALTSFLPVWPPLPPQCLTSITRKG